MKKLSLIVAVLSLLAACQPKTDIDLGFNLTDAIQKKGVFRMVGITDNPPYFMRTELDIDFDLNHIAYKNNQHLWEITFQHVRMVQGQPVGQDIYFDSNPKGENSALNEHISGTYNSMINVPIPIVTDGYGNILEAIPYDSIFGGAAFVVQNNSNLSQILKYLFLPYPKHLVGDGSTWDTSYVLAYSSAMNMTDEFTFLDNGDDYGIQIETDIEPNFKHEKSFDDVQEGNGTQSVKMNLDEHSNLLEALSLKQELSMHYYSDNAQIGEKKDFTVKFKTDITITIR